REQFGRDEEDDDAGRRVERNVDGAQRPVRWAEDFPNRRLEDRITRRMLDEVRVARRIEAAQEMRQVAVVQDLRVRLVLFRHACEDELLPVVLPVKEPDAEREQKER